MANFPSDHHSTDTGSGAGNLEPIETISNVPNMNECQKICQTRKVWVT